MTRAVRAGLRASAVTASAAVLTLALAPPASANTPLRGWDDGSDMSVLGALLLFVGVPLAIVLGITLFVLAPSLVSGSRDQGSASRWGEAQWFGGELGAGSAERPQLEAASGATSSEDVDQVVTGGGASARW